MEHHQEEKSLSIIKIFFLKLYRRDLNAYKSLLSGTSDVGYGSILCEKSNEIPKKSHFQQLFYPKKDF